MLGLPQTGIARAGRDERRLVERVLRHWTQLAARRRFPRFNEIDRWMTGDDRANCVLIAVQSPVELSHFSAVGENLAVALCPGNTLAGVLLSHLPWVVSSRCSLIVEGGATLRGVPILYRGGLCSHCPKTASHSTMCWARRTIARCSRTMRRRSRSSGHVGFRPRVSARKHFSLFRLAGAA